MKLRVSISSCLCMVLVMAMGGCGRQVDETPAAPAAPESVSLELDLPADFTPQLEDFADDGIKGKYLGMRLFRGRDMTERNGIHPIYVVSARKGRLKGDPIDEGDLILGVNGEPLGENPVYRFKTIIYKASEEEDSLTVTRWRKGETATFTIDLKPVPPDLTQGDKINDLHPWQLGPTGLKGWVHSVKMDEGASRDARQIYVTEVAAGSAADGKLAVGDVIVGIGGEKFTMDARKALAGAIVKAEMPQNKGQLKLNVWRDGEAREATLTLKVLPAPSATSPYDCPKTEAIVEAACDYMKTRKLKPGWLGYIDALGMLSTGREDLMPQVKAFAHDICIPGEVLSVEKHQSMLCWNWSYKLVFLSEYYLKTGDKYVLPTITEYATKLSMGQSGVGTWGHSVASRQYNKGKLHGHLGGYGAINQMGLTAMVGLPLALKCGVDNEEIRAALKRGETFFSYYIDKGAIPYGDHRPNTLWFDDNGKSGSAAVMFDLLDNEEGSQFFSKMVLGSAPSGREAGHTGCFWSHLWGGVGAARSGRTGMQTFMREMDWAFTLERKTNGSFIFQGNAGEAGGHGHWDCTGARLLQLCVPRKLLYVTGRDMKVENPVGSDRIKELLAAGRLYSDRTARKSLSKAEIMELLADGLPAVRMVGARALREQKLKCVDELVAMLDSDNRYAQYGACYALSESGYGSAKAVKRLVQLVDESDDLDLKLNALDALTSSNPDVSLAKSAKSAIPSLLRLAVKHYDVDPRRLLQRRLCFALFDQTGLLTIHGIDDVDSSLLVPAIKELLTGDDGRARSLVASVFSKLKDEDLEVLWGDIYLATRDLAPSGMMFADGVRASGLMLMAERKVTEGIDLTLDFMREDRWGQGHRQKAAVGVVAEYGPAAKAALPDLLAMKQSLSGKKGVEGDLAKIEKAIGAVQSGEQEELISIAPYLEKGARR